jgi:hypothetical protein
MNTCSILHTYIHDTAHALRSGWHPSKYSLSPFGLCPHVEHLTVQLKSISYIKIIKCCIQTKNFGRPISFMQVCASTRGVQDLIFEFQLPYIHHYITICRHDVSTLMPPLSMAYQDKLRTVQWNPEYSDIPRAFFAPSSTVQAPILGFKQRSSWTAYSSER